MYHRKTLLVVWSLVAIAIAGGADAQTRDENWAQCGKPFEGDATIAACTAIIQSGVETTESLATLFLNRGAAHSNKASGAQIKDKGEYDLAIRDFDEALRIKPNYAEAYFERSTAHRFKGRNFGNNGEYDLAIKDSNEAIRLKPDYPSYVARGLAYHLKGQYDLAVQDFDESIKLKPVYFVFLLRGRVYRDMGEYDRAIADYDNAEKLGASYAPAARCEANALAGRFQAALAECTKYADANHDASSYGPLGFVYLKMKEAGKAIAAYDTALKATPNNASFLYGRGRAKLVLNDPTAAKADMDAARRIDPRIDETFVKAYKFPPAP